MNFSFFIAKINPVYFELIIDNHVVEYNHVISLYSHEYETRRHVAVHCRVCPCGTSGIYEVLPIVLLYTKFMRVPMDQNICVQLSLNCRKRF